VTLSKKQIKHLKALAHSKKPVVTVGQNGASESVMQEIKLALDHHELIKVKLPALAKNDREILAEEICNASRANTIILIGRVVVLFSPAKDSAITLPA